MLIQWQWQSIAYTDQVTLNKVVNTFCAVTTMCIAESFETELHTKTATFCISAQCHSKSSMFTHHDTPIVFVIEAVKDLSLRHRPHKLV